MPVPADADTQQDNTSKSYQQAPNTPPTRSAVAGGPASSIPASPASSACASSAPNDEATTSQKMNDSIVAPSNGGPAANSPIEIPEQTPPKIFVGGLSGMTSEEKLREIFEGYGEVTECNIMKDPVTKKSRGFGFVTFKGADIVKTVLDTHQKSPIAIDEKLVDPKIAVPPKRLSNKVKRIFVGGVSSDCVDDDLKEYFEQFGKVSEAQLMYDRNTNRHRGFGFVTFESEEPAEKVCSIQYHDIKGKKVEVKVAQTKEALAMQQGRKYINNPRNYSQNFNSYGNQAFAQFYHPHTYPMEMMSGMGGFNGPLMLATGGNGAKLNRGSKTRGGYSQYTTYYPQGNWPDHRMGGGYYGPPGGYGMPIPMMGRHMGMDPANMDYLAEQFQGLAMSSYYNHSPPSGTQYPGNMGAMDTTGGSYSPPHNLSPKGLSSSSAVNGYNSVQNYTGNHSNSYAVAQPTY